MRRILIIGAGFTGLMAAYELSKKGFSVTVIERGPNIGGLAGGFTIEGASLERAYHHLFRTDTDILDLINELGLQEKLGWHESKVAIVVPKNNNAQMLQSPNALNKQTIRIYPFNGVVDLLKFSPLSFIDRVRAGAVTFFLQKYTNWKTLVSVTALSWMQKWAGPNVTNVLWGPLLKGKFSTFSDKVSMAWLWARIHIRANSRTSMFAKELLAYPQGGFTIIADALVAHIEAIQGPKDSWLLTSTTIEKISYPEGKPTITIAGKEQSYDAILATIPAQGLQKLIPEYQPTGHIDYLGAVVLTFSSEQSLSDFYWHTITDISAPFLVFLQHTNLVPKAWYNNKNVYYIGAYVPQNSPYLTTYTEDQIKEKWFAYLKELFPAFDPSKISQLTLSRFAAAQHVVDVDYAKNIPPYETGLPHTYLSNFAQIFPEDRGTNYAIREGKKIADMIATDLLQLS